MKDGPPLIHMILADAELEMVPRHYWSHAAVSANAKKRKKKASRTLLDSSLHHSIFEDHDDKNRRGRPDIAHFFLLLGLDSLLNSRGGLRLWIHTRNDQLIEVDPETRLPKSFNRFKGLMEDLFLKGAVPNKERPLMSVTGNMAYGSCMNRIGGYTEDRGRDLIPIVLHNEGEEIVPYDFFSRLRDEGELEGKDLALTIGGFSHGDFRSDVKGKMRISLHPELLKVWTVQSEIMVGFRQSLFP